MFTDHTFDIFWFEGKSTLTGLYIMEAGEVEETLELLSQDIFHYFYFFWLTFAQIK